MKYDANDQIVYLYYINKNDEIYNWVYYFNSSSHTSPFFQNKLFFFFLLKNAADMENKDVIGHKSYGGKGDTVEQGRYLISVRKWYWWGCREKKPNCEKCEFFTTGPTQVIGPANSLMKIGFCFLHRPSCFLHLILQCNGTPISYCLVTAYGMYGWWKQLLILKPLNPINNVGP